MSLEDNSANLTRKERRRLRRQGQQEQGNSQPRGLNLNYIQAKTPNQQAIFEDYHEGYNLLIHGVAGTGKSFLSIFLALQECMTSPLYDKVVIIRSTVASRSQGFLPGNEKQKAAVYEAPYRGICTELFGRGDAYELLKQKNIIEFESTSYLRGTTYRDCIVVVDEVQNMTDSEINTVMTRVGENCRIVACGDFRQNDLANSRHETSGVHNLLDIAKRMDSFALIEMGIDDIVRSGFVKEWITARVKLGLV